MTEENMIHEELAKLDGTWQQTESRSGGGINVPDDDYISRLTKMYINKSKKGRLQVCSLYTIADGNYEGKEIMRFDGLDTEQSIAFFKGYCETIGLEVPTSMTDLPAALEAFTDGFDGLVNITMKTKGEYQNLYVKGLVSYE